MRGAAWPMRLRVIPWIWWFFDLKVHNISCKTDRYGAYMLRNHLIPMQVLWNPVRQPKMPQTIQCPSDVR